MPNIKSAKKRVLVSEKKAEQNKAIRSEVKSEIKKVLNLVKENKAEEAKAALPAAFAVIDSAASKNIIHANNAANKKAKLAKKVNSMAIAATPVEEVKPAAAPAVEEVAAPVEQAPVKKTRKTSAKKAAEQAE